jgi:hypothetical protein
MGKWSCIVLSVLFLLSVLLNIWQYRSMRGIPSVADTVEVVRWDTVHDTLPPLKGEKVISYVTIPCHHDTAGTGNGNIQDDSICGGSVTLPVVQRKYSDDSTYTAYVSGLRVDSFPRLDSIDIRMRTVERTVTRTVYMKRSGLSVKVRPALSGGYDPFGRKWGVLVGGAVVLDW